MLLTSETSSKMRQFSKINKFSNFSHSLFQNRVLKVRVSISQDQTSKFYWIYFFFRERERERESWKFDRSISHHLKSKPYLKSQASCGWVSTVDDFPKQLSHTRTGAWPQPRSGTGFLLVEHASQTPPPQARQWCLVSPSAKRRQHDWHAWKWM